jgi:ankyrin repeat protein
LHQAAMMGHVRIVDALIKGGANLNVPNNDGWTPLHQAIADANVEVINSLVAAGADLNILDLRDVSPLDLAKRRKKAPVLAALGITA